MKTLNEVLTEMSDKGDSHFKWANSYREDWMTDDQWFMYLFLNRVFRGFHHIPGNVKQCGERSICINSRTSYMATYDYDYLTKLVIIAHNWGIRAAIVGSGPGMIKIQLWKRHARDGDISERIPTIQSMVEKYKDF